MKNLREHETILGLPCPPGARPFLPKAKGTMMQDFSSAMHMYAVHMRTACHNTLQFHICQGQHLSAQAAGGWLSHVASLALAVAVIVHASKVKSARIYQRALHCKHPMTKRSPGSCKPTCGGVTGSTPHDELGTLPKLNPKPHLQRKRTRTRLFMIKNRAHLLRFSQAWT